MLGEPCCGWVRINVGDCYINASYLTDVPFDLLDGFIDCLVNYQTVAICFDEEGSSGYLILNGVVAYVLTVRAYIKAENEQFYVNELAEELIKDIQNNIDGWATWGIYEDEVKEYHKEVSERKQDLIDKCNIIKGKLW